MKAKVVIITVLLPMLHYMVLAQDISVLAEYPGVVRLGQQFSVSWTINSGGGDFSEPSFDGFYKLMGPQTSYSSSTQIINGKITRETTYTYVYYLQALKEGLFIIPPAQFTLKNKTYTSDSLRIEVIGGTANQSLPGAGNDAGQTEVESADEDIFVRLLLDKKEAFQGEHIVATVKLYSRIDISGINEIKFPGFEGFLKTDLETPPLTSLTRENINGTIYGTGIIQRFLLYPQISGEIDINPVQISVLIRQRSGESDPFFGDFFATYTTVPKAIISSPLRVKVKPLPGTKPADFSGIVGKVSLTTLLDKDTVNVNDAVNLKMILAGSGNLKIANSPDMKLPPDIEIYDPKVTDDLTSGTGGTNGRKIFEYLLIPRHYGDYTVPPVSYSYFNISTGQYETLTTPELHFYARKVDDQGTGITVFGGIAKEDVRYLGQDIRFIKSDAGKLKRSGKNLSSKRSFYTAYAFALIMFLLILFIRREQIKRNADIARVRNRKAGKTASKRLKEAEKCLKGKQNEKFYEEILRALWGYLSDKLNIPVSELNRSNAVNSLSGKGIDPTEIDNLTFILDTCEYARFAPSSSASEAGKIFEGASRFIRYVENTIG